MLLCVFSCYEKLCNVVTTREGVHRLHHDCFHYGSKSSSSQLFFDRFVYDIVESLIGKMKFDTIHCKEFYVLTDNGVFGFSKNALEGTSF